MKIKFVLLFTFFTIENIYSQNLTWEKCYGGASSEFGQSIIRLDDGTFVSVGSTRSNGGDVIGLHGILDDEWLIRIDSSGTLISQKCFGGTDVDRATKIIRTFDNGFAICGYSESNNGDATSSGHHNFEDFWIIKTDSAFNIVWQRCFGSYATDIAYSISQCTDSGFVVVGNVANSGGDVLTWHGGNDIFVTKISKIGVKQWVKTLGGSGNDEGRDCCQTPDGGFFILGSGNSYDGDLPFNHIGSIYIFKLDSIGSLQWTRTYGGTSGEDAGSFIYNSDGRITIVGTTSSDDGDVVGHVFGADVWVLQIDLTGNLLWQRCIGTNGIESGRCINSTSDGGFILGASSYASDSIIQNYGGFDCWIIKLDSLGQYQWSKIVGGSDKDEINSILQISDHDYIYVASTASNDFDVTFNHSQYNDLWIGQLSDQTVNLQNLSNSIEECTAFFIDDNLTLKLICKEYSTSTLNFLNLNGQIIFSQEIKLYQGINYITLQIPLPKGICLFSLLNDKFVFTKKVFHY